MKIIICFLFSLWLAIPVMGAALQPRVGGVEVIQANNGLSTNLTARGVTLPALTANRPLILNGSGNATNATGTPDGSKFLRDDGTLAVPAGTGGGSTNAITNSAVTSASGTIPKLTDRVTAAASGLNVDASTNLTGAGSATMQRGLTNYGTEPIESVGGFRGAAAAGVPSQVVWPSTNANGIEFTIQSGIIYSNLVLLTPTNGFNGIADPVLVVTNVSGVGGNYTGQLSWVSLAVLGSTNILTRTNNVNVLASGGTIELTNGANTTVFATAVGGKTIYKVDATGVSDTVILSPATGTRNVISNSTDNTALTVSGTTGNTSPTFIVRKGDGSQLLGVYDNGRVKIGADGAPAYPVDVAGGVNATSFNLNSLLAFTRSGAWLVFDTEVAAPGSINPERLYVHRGSANLSTNDLNTILQVNESASATHIPLQLRGAVNQSGDLFQVGSSNMLKTNFLIGANGTATATASDTNQVAVRIVSSSGLGRSTNTLEVLGGVDAIPLPGTNLVWIGYGAITNAWIPLVVGATWSNANNTYTAFQVSVQDKGSAAASKLFDFGTNNGSAFSSKISADKTGLLTAAGGITTPGNIVISGSFTGSTLTIDNGGVGLTSVSAGELNIFGASFTTMTALQLGTRSSNTHAMVLSSTPPMYFMRDGLKISNAPVHVGTLTISNNFIPGTNDDLLTVYMPLSTTKAVKITPTGKLNVGSWGGTLATVGGTYSVDTTPVASAGTAETNLITRSILAHTLTNNGDRVRFRFAGNFAATANAKDMKVIFGSETILDTSSQIVNGGAWTIEGEIIRTGNTSQETSAEFHGAGVTLFSTAAAPVLAQTNGIATTLKMTSTAAGNGDVTNRTLVVQYFPAP